MEAEEAVAALGLPIRGTLLPSAAPPLLSRPRAAAVRQWSFQEHLRRRSNPELPLPEQRSLTALAIIPLQRQAARLYRSVRTPVVVEVPAEAAADGNEKPDRRYYPLL